MHYHTFLDCQIVFLVFNIYIYIYNKIYILITGSRIDSTSQWIHKSKLVTQPVHERF